MFMLITSSDKKWMNDLDRLFLFLFSFLTFSLSLGKVLSCHVSVLVIWKPITHDVHIPWQVLVGRPLSEYHLVLHWLWWTWYCVQIHLVWPPFVVSRHWSVSSKGPTLPWSETPCTSVWTQRHRMEAGRLETSSCGPKWNNQSITSPWNNQSITSLWNQSDKVDMAIVTLVGKVIILSSQSVDTTRL